MRTLVRLPSCSAIREVQAEYIKEAADPTAPATMPANPPVTATQGPSKWQGLAGLGGRRWAGIGALAGGALGALNPGKDDDGESRGALSGALRGAMTGGLVGGLGGMAAKRFLGPTGAMTNMNKATEAGHDLMAGQAGHSVGLAKAQAGISNRLGEGIFNPGPTAAIRASGYRPAVGTPGQPGYQPEQHMGQARAFMQRVLPAWMGGTSSYNIGRAQNNLGNTRAFQHQGEQNAAELQFAQQQAAHQRALQALDPAHAQATQAATQAAADAAAHHRDRAATLNRLLAAKPGAPAPIDHSRMTPEQLDAHIPALVAAGHLTPAEGVSMGHASPAAAVTPPVAPTSRDAAASVYQLAHGAAPHAGYNEASLNQGLRNWAASSANAQHTAMPTVQQHLATLPPQQPNPQQPNPQQPNPQQPNPQQPNPQIPPRHLTPGQDLGRALNPSGMPPWHIQGLLRSGLWRRQTLPNGTTVLVKHASKVISPIDIFSPTLKLAAPRPRPFSSPKQTVKERVQGAFAPRKTKNDTAPVAADAADPPKPAAAAKPADVPESADDKKVTASPPLAATMPPGTGPATAVAPLKTAEVPVPAAAAVAAVELAKVAAAAEPAKVAAVAEPAIKTIKLAALAA